MWRSIHYLFIVFFVVGCSVYARYNLDEQFGRTDSNNRKPFSNTSNIDYRHDIKPILDQRCVACHACYDSPCQLNLTATEGLERGSNKNKVYDPRLIAAPLTRLFEDAISVTDWRAKGFSPVLNERTQTSSANINSSVLAQMLLLKQKNPITNTQDISNNFKFSLNRDQQCPTIEEFETFSSKHSLWGMPYGLPAISDNEHTLLLNWISEGAPYSPPASMTKDYRHRIDEWEHFLNGDSLKEQLMSRYLFEHLFIANIYFNDLSQRQYFRLVRSKTEPGKPIQHIATRRPFDDPNVNHVYYRLAPSRQTVVAKTHMPYAFSPVRMERFRELFLADNYVVTKLPSYQADIASNPFIAFKAIPAQSRYRFLLDEAQNTIMGFIKGPVCRGQLALSVIQDHFWVFFVDPDNAVIENDSKFLNEVAPILRLPAENQSNALNPLTWLEYSKLQKEYLQMKIRYLNESLPSNNDINLDLIWKGDGWNDNAALTVFRHFDSASVVKGLVGQEPKTAWVIGYSLLERIHYLLVAGFDVYGNVGHQLYTRLYMDFLRMDGEFNFLSLLPLRVRSLERDYWYTDATDYIQNHIGERDGQFFRESGIKYQTDNPKLELFTKLKAHIGSVLNTKVNIEYSTDPISKKLQTLTQFSNNNVTLLPETSVLSIVNSKGAQATPVLYTLIRNVARKNISHLLLENDTLQPKQDYLTIVQGIVGAYPNAFFKVDIADLDIFMSAISTLSTQQDYLSLKAQYGVTRTNPKFWQHSDEVLAAYRQIAPLSWGILDYSRLEHRAQ